jgi:hypothetical protein
VADQAPINDAVGFLSAHDPERLQRLRKQFSSEDEAALLAEEEWLKPLPPLLAPRIHAVVEGLNAFLVAWNGAMPSATKRLERANQWKVVGAFVATLGSSTTLTFLFAGPSTHGYALASTVVALFGSLAGLAANYLRSDLFGTNDGLPAVVKRLSANASKAAVLVRSLTPYLDVNDDGDDPAALEQMIGDANAILGEVGPDLVIMGSNA